MKFSQNMWAASYYSIPFVLCCFTSHFHIIYSPLCTLFVDSFNNQYSIFLWTLLATHLWHKAILIHQSSWSRRKIRFGTKSTWCSANQSIVNSPNSPQLHNPISMQNHVHVHIQLLDWINCWIDTYKIWTTHNLYTWYHMMNHMIYNSTYFFKLTSVQKEQRQG